MTKDTHLMLTAIFIFVAFFLGLIIGGLGAVKVDGYVSEQQIIEANCGYYDPQTREFKFGRLK